MIDTIEPFMKSLLDGTIKVEKASESGEVVILTPDELMEEMKDGCNPFWIYKEDLEYKDYFFNEIDNITETWTRYADEPNKQVYTKAEPGSSIYSVFFKFKVPTNMLYPLTLIDDVKKYTEWVPRVLKSELQYEHSETRRVIAIENAFPWPLANRELVICGSAVLCKER